MVATRGFKDKEKAPAIYRNIQHSTYSVESFFGTRETMQVDTRRAFTAALFLPLLPQRRRAGARRHLENHEQPEEQERKNQQWLPRPVSPGGEVPKNGKLLGRINPEL